MNPTQLGKESSSIIPYGLESCQRLVTVIEPQWRGRLCQHKLSQVSSSTADSVEIKTAPLAPSFPFSMRYSGSTYLEEEGEIPSPTWDEKQRCYLRFIWGAVRMRWWVNSAFIHLFTHSTNTYWVPVLCPSLLLVWGQNTHSDCPHSRREIGGK